MLQPLRDQVIIKEIEKNERKIGSIYVPATAQQDNITIGEIVAVGSGLYLDNGTRLPLEVEIGDNVMFDRRNGIIITYKEEKYFQMSESGILSKIPPQ